ncbi:TatD family hydrolase [Neptunomonas antarctica]|uniref:TatD DNase family protein n=1 Tax=Neptunomonas antarctica TaxID=619304 RepID=A0A1N7J8U9_9GAMM|nr:TatD family hydrolase [Neptunomonas antarctica]SIS45730.1 TatD DNase family protein [Neptunomonas antarctica]
MADWQIIDSHCHLDFPVFDGVRPQRVVAALQAGVGRIIVPGVAAKDFQRVVDTASAFANVYFSLGLHPCFMPEHQADDLQILADWVAQYPVCAIGEIGLDFYIPDHDSAAQIALLKAQLKIAKQHQLPVLLHVRKAHDVMLKTLRDLQFEQGGIVHAFNGSAQQANIYIKMGFKLGFGGTLTYPGSHRIRALAAELPLESIVLETDAPDMPLYGRRGEPNQPAYVADVLKELAQLRVEPIETIATLTSANVEQLLSLN